ncbi:hypothetical protein HDV00_009348 [Rhizophlyctis rosea]|nr:hypothetical protein HDV00_009348 [Rhizophlyctis rosea]
MSYYPEDPSAAYYQQQQQHYDPSSAAAQSYDPSTYDQYANAAYLQSESTYYDNNGYASAADPYASSYPQQPYTASASSTSGPSVSYAGAPATYHAPTTGPSSSAFSASVSYAGPTMPAASSNTDPVGSGSYAGAADGNIGGYTVTSEEGAVSIGEWDWRAKRAVELELRPERAAPYPEGYTPNPASAKVITIGAEEKKAAAFAALPSLSSSTSTSISAPPTIIGTTYTTPGAAASAHKKKKKNIVRAAGGEVWEDPTLLEWDESDFRLFCGDLGNEVNDDLLLKAFSRYTSVQKARVVRDKRTSKSKGYGFVSFKDPNDFVKALREMNGKYVGNRPIKLRKSTWDERNADARSLRKTIGGGVVKEKAKVK